ncbi:MAG: hypothetical protein WD557_16325 [Dehalococcoidia bacterium]
MMWLPPLRPVLPEGAPIGVSLGAFKPQRDIEHAFWPGPPAEVLGNWEPWASADGDPRPRGRLAAAIMALFGVTA